MHDATPETPTLDQVANHLFAAFRPRSGNPASCWTARDVTLGQLRTLFMIRSEGPVSIGRIADAFAIGAAAASGYIERIERHGLVERRHRTDDRRIVDCHLTETGRQLLDDLAGVQIDALHQALAALSSEQLTEFDRLLSVIAARTRDAASAKLGESFDRSDVRSPTTASSTEPGLTETEAARQA